MKTVTTILQIFPSDPVDSYGPDSLIHFFENPADDRMKEKFEDSFK